VSWATSDRRKRLPPDWPALRLACLKRDNWECQWPAAAGICGAYANQCDHINPGGADDLANLRSLCTPHHSARSSQQGGHAWGVIRRRMAAAKYRTPEPHPGLIRNG